MASRRFWSLPIILWGWCQGRKPYPSTTNPCICVTSSRAQVTQGLLSSVFQCSDITALFFAVLPSSSKTEDFAFPFRKLSVNKIHYWTLSFNRHLLNRFICFWVFCVFSRATPVAYGGSQARGLVRAIAAGLCQSHNTAGSELRLWPTP